MTDLHRVIVAVALICCFITAAPADPQQPGAGSESKPQPASPPQGTRPPQRGRGAEGTREFLGLGTPPDPVAAERGSKTYAATCSFCHGAKATGGDTGPDLIRSTLVLHDEKGNLIGPLVHSGRIARGMPSFPAFTDAELSDIAEFLHMRVELTANRGTYKILDVVTGNAKAGQAYFQGPGGCSSCHSTTGDLAHIGSKLSPADLQQTFLYPSARGSSAGEGSTQKVTVTLASGQQLSGSLKRIDDFDLGLIDDRGNYHSIAIDSNTKVQLEDKLFVHRQLLDQYTDADMHNLTAYLVTLK